MKLADEWQRMLIECQTKMMQDVMDRSRDGRNEGVHGVSLADFLNTRPIPFALAQELMDAEDWLLDTKRKLNTMNCSDGEKIRYATHLLCGPVAAWWDNIVAIHPPGRVFTWDEFKNKFREANVPESIMVCVGPWWPLSFSPSDLWKLPVKIRLQKLVSSNSENISCVSLLKHKNSRKQGTGTVATC
jgi:hypothetical protein